MIRGDTALAIVFQQCWLLWSLRFCDASCVVLTPSSRFSCAQKIGKASVFVVARNRSGIVFTESLLVIFPAKAVWSNEKGNFKG